MRGDEQSRGGDAAENGDRFGPAAVAHCLRVAQQRLGIARHPGPPAPRVLRFARELLRASARTARGQHTGALDLLFVCERGDGASQIAAALARRGGAARVAARAAGVEPAPELAPGVDALLRELGTDPADEFPLPVAPEFVAAADVIVTLTDVPVPGLEAAAQLVAWPETRVVGLEPRALREVATALEPRVVELLRARLS